MTVPEVERAPLTLVVVGCGRVVERYHVPALQRTPEWKVVGACDPLRERREWMRGRLANVPVFESFVDLVEGCRPDAALVATPPHTQSAVVVVALEMGLHVLVEKPMTLTAAEADGMWATARRAGKRLGIGFSRRFKRSYLALRERLALLQPGEVQVIRFNLVGNAEAWKPVTDFLGDEQRGGGVLDDMASHQLDLLPWLVRQRISRVRARGHSVGKERVEQIACELEFENGLSALCNVGHGARRDETLQVELRDRQLVVSADQLFECGRWSAGSTRAYCRLRSLCERALGRQPAPEDGVTPFAKQLRAFATAAGNMDGHADMADGSSGVGTVRVVEACRESLRSGGSWIAMEPPTTTA